MRCDTCSKNYHSFLHGFFTRRNQDNDNQDGDGLVCNAEISTKNDNTLAVLLDTDFFIFVIGQAASILSVNSSIRRLK